jgi:chromosome segregation ATPase
MVAANIASTTGDDVDEEMIDTALTTSQTVTNKEIQAIEERANTAEARLREKQEEIRRLEQSIASHEEELAKKRMNNTTQGDDSEDGKRRKAILEEEYAQLEELEH